MVTNPLTKQNNITKRNGGKGGRRKEEGRSERISMQRNSPKTSGVEVGAVLSSLLSSPFPAVWPCRVWFLLRKQQMQRSDGMSRGTPKQPIRDQTLGRNLTLVGLGTPHWPVGLWGLWWGIMYREAPGFQGGIWEDPGRGRKGVIWTISIKALRVLN